MKHIIVMNNEMFKSLSAIVSYMMSESSRVTIPDISFEDVDNVRYAIHGSHAITLSENDTARIQLHEVSFRDTVIDVIGKDDES